MADAAPNVPKLSSFSIAAKPKKAPVQNSGFKDDKRRDDDDDEAPAVAELVSEMKDGQVDGKKEQVRVIPAIQNTFTLGGAQHLRGALEQTQPAAPPPERDEGEGASTAVVAAAPPTRQRQRSGG